ncbi:MAG: guanylate kinase [Phycisphaerales bacterium]
MAHNVGMLLVICGPSGVGKTTITHAVEKQIPGAVFSVSCTTRAKTDKDREGVDYFFVSDEEFDRLISENAFLEHAGVFGKRYGTPKKWVDDRLAEGKLVILEIDVQGAINVKKHCQGAFCLFVLPPSEEELLARLRGRGREDEAKIQRRFGEARREIEVSRNCGVYDVFLVNRLLEAAVAQSIGLVTAEWDRRRKAGQ